MCSRIFNSNNDRTVFSLFYANEFFLYSLFACQFHLRIQMLPNLLLADVITFLSSHAYTTSILVFMHRNTHFKFIRDYLCKSRIRKFWHFYCNLTLKTSRIILSYNQHWLEQRTYWNFLNAWILFTICIMETCNPAKISCIFFVLKCIEPLQ